MAHPRGVTVSHPISGGAPGLTVGWSAGKDGRAQVAVVAAMLDATVGVRCPQEHETVPLSARAAVKTDMVSVDAGTLKLWLPLGCYIQSA